MLTKDELDFLNKIPADKNVHICPFNPKVADVVETLIQSIHNIDHDLEIKHMGASALGISGQNDLDVYAFSDPSDFKKYLPDLMNLFGKPLHKHETFVEWKLKKEGFDIEFYLTSPDSETMKKQIKVFEILKKHLSEKKFKHCIIEEKQLQYLFERDDLTFPSCEKIEKDGYCIKGCDIKRNHNIYK